MFKQILAAIALTFTSQTSSQSIDPPNVLFIVIDDASWEEFTNLSLPTVQYGSALGRVYTNFYTTPVCSPTRAQFNFGRYSHDYLLGKAIDPAVDGGVPTSEVSLAETMGAAGYNTGMFGKWHLNGAPLPIVEGYAPNLHGYDTWQAGSVSNVKFTGGSHYNWERWDDGVSKMESQYSTHAIGDALTSWWSNTSGPKFAVCAFLAPHYPFELAPADLLNGQTFASTDRGRYESALVAVDSKILQIAASIDLSNTYVFLFPDNGTPHQVPPPFGQQQGYKLTTYQGGINVPLVVWGPDIFPGYDSGLVQAVDLPATVLDLAGIQKPPGAMEDSISFATTLDRSGSSARHYIWSQRFGPNHGPHPFLDFHLWAVLRDDGYKLVRVEQWPGLGIYKTKLFNVFTDPFETTQLSNSTVKQQLQVLKSQALGPHWPY